MTPLARAHAAMAERPGDLGFWDLFARSELILALKAEPMGDTFDPQVFETSDGAFALAFTTQEGLADFAGGVAPYAALPGRVLAAMLGGAGQGLAIDAGGDAVLLTAGELLWLTETLGTAADEALDALDEVLPPGEVPAGLLEAIGGRLGPGLCEGLAIARVRSGTETVPLLAILGARPGTAEALTAAMTEALAFAGAGPEWRIGHFPAAGPVAEALLRRGMRLEITARDLPRRPGPGTTPGKPPRLR